MSVSGRLMAWIELIDCTTITDYERVNTVLDGLVVDDENWECEGVQWNDDKSMVIAYEVTYWNDVPPDFATLVDNLVKALQPDEHMTFEEKVRFGQRTTTMRTLLVSGKGVFCCDSSCMMETLQEIAESEPLEGGEELNL